MEHNMEGFIEEDTFDEENDLIYENDGEGLDYENQEVIEILLNDETYSNNLTDLEVDFLNSLIGKRNLTENQQDKLDNIWNEIVTKGRN